MPLAFTSVGKSACANQCDNSMTKAILGYTNKLTVRPGADIDFKISVEGGGAYTAQLVRLVNGDVHSKFAGFKEIEVEAPINGRYEGQHQGVAPGSCIIVEQVGPLHASREFTLAINIMPTIPMHGTQRVIGRWDARARTGWSLHVNGAGQLAFTAADAERVSVSLALKEPLRAKAWYRATLRISNRARTIALDCRRIDDSPYKSNVIDSATALLEFAEFPSEIGGPLLMAAAFGGRDASGRVIPVECFNGRLEAPIIYRGLPSNCELEQILVGERPVSLKARLIADWDFSEGMSGIDIVDRSSNRLDGITQNLPLRAVRGTCWRGTTMEWPNAQKEYAAIHFHGDDLYDCGWRTSISYQLPDDFRSGVYALRLRLCDGIESADNEEYLPFFVAAPRGAPQARIAFMAPTYTYLAYGNMRGIEGVRKRSGLSEEEYYPTSMMGPGTREYALMAEQHREFGLSVYDRHLDGSPVHFSSCLRPLLNLRPKSLLWGLCADLLIIDWLHAQGFEYDVVTDDLLQEEGGSVLQHYSVVITGNHPEYCTTKGLDALESYVARGGRLMYLGGNGFYWRAAVHEALPGAIEVRRGRTGTGTWQSEVGEGCLALSAEIGGIWRDLGRPPQRQFGVGFIAEGRDSAHYRILPNARRSSAEFIFKDVEDDVIGDFGIFGGAAAGQEIDKTNLDHGTPDEAIVVARSENHGPRMLYVIEEMESNNPVLEKYRKDTCAEIAYFETRNGGAVFSVGSMAWCGSLGHNGYKNNVSTITANVLNQFLKREMQGYQCTEPR